MMYYELKFFRLFYIFETLSNYGVWYYVSLVFKIIWWGITMYLKMLNMLRSLTNLYLSYLLEFQNTKFDIS